MEHAGMLDGDLITHINGAGVALDAAEKFEWEAKVRPTLLQGALTVFHTCPDCLD